MCSNLKKSRARLSIRKLLILIAIVCIALAVFTRFKWTGSDRLHSLMLECNKVEEPVFYWAYSIGDSSKYLDESALFEVGNENPNARWFDKWLGDSKDQMEFLRFEESSSFKDKTNVLRQIASNRSARKIKTLEILDMYDEATPCFFKNWNIEYLVLRDSQIPDQWREEIARLPNLKRLVISGRDCNLEPEALVEATNLETLTLCERGISRMRLDALKSALPNVEIRLLGSYDSPWKFDGDEDLSEANKEVSAKVRATLNRLAETLSSFKPTKKFDFQPPATESEIRLLEQRLGFPINPQARALLELSNGWDSPDRRFFSCEEIWKDYQSREEIQTYAIDYYFAYDFTETYDHFSNPNVISIGDGIGMGSNRTTLYSMDDGGEFGPSEKNFSGLFDYFEKMIQELESSRRPDGSSELYDPKYGFDLYFWWE